MFNKNRFKHFLKNSPFILNCLVKIIFLYLKLVYVTNRWKIIYPDNINENVLKAKHGLLFALWHNRLAFHMHIFKNYNDLLALASPHSDGKLIINILKLMKYRIIEGSTNKNPTNAIRQIIKYLNDGSKVAITPDGPRGPIYKINSNITRIAYKYQKQLIPFSCAASKFIELKSWDRMIIPKPFGQIIVVFGKPLELQGDLQMDNELLERELVQLSEEANKMIQNLKEIRP